MTRIVGSSVERVEDRALLRGQACFVDDIAFPGMLHAAFVRSAQAHALHLFAALIFPQPSKCRACARFGAWKISSITSMIRC